MVLTAGERKGGFHINPNDDLSSVPKNRGWAGFFLGLDK
jgi:hypothetical protein